MSEKASAKPSKDVVYVDVDDEITGIIDKVENSDHKIVALVLPKRAASLQSIVNMKLLKRSADGAGKNVVLITSESALLPLAGAAGLHVAKNLQSTPELPDSPSDPAASAAKPAAAAAAAGLAAGALAAKATADDGELPEKINYDKPIGALADKHDVENPETIDLDDEDEAEDKPEAKAAKAPKDKKNKVPNFDRFRLMLMLGALGFVALIVFIYLALVVLPKASITIHTTSEPVSATFDINASPDAEIDAAKGTIPSKLETMDQTGTQQVTATGQKNNGDKATGTVTMSAEKCSGNPFDAPSDVPAGIGISSGGLNYIAQQSTSFHGTGVDSSGCYTYEADGDTAVTAQAAGSKYNVDNASFTVVGRSDVSATGSASGGSDDIVTILSQADVDGAKDKLTTGTTGTDFVKSFEDKLAAQGEYVFTSTMKAGTAKITSTPAVGQPASTANVTIKVLYSVLTVQKSDLETFLQAKLAKQIDKSKQKLSDSLLSDTSFNILSQSGASASISAVVDTTAVPIINQTAVKELAKGKKVGDIQAAINNWAGVKSVDVHLSPFWVSKAPKNTAKITVTMQEVKTTGSQDSGNNNGQP